MSLALQQAVSAAESVSYQQPGGNLSVSSRSPRDVFQAIFQANKEADAKKAKEKLAALVLKQQAKMAAGGRHFDPSLQVICHVIEMLIS